MADNLPRRWRDRAAALHHRLMRLTQRPVPPLLHRYVSSIWAFESAPGEIAHARERALPGAGMQLLVNLGEDELRWWSGERFERPHRIAGAAIEGPRDVAIAIDTAQQAAMVGVAFHPAGASGFFRTPASALHANHVELDAVWGRDGVLVRDRLLAEPTMEARLEVLQRMLLSRFVPRGDAVFRAVAALDAGWSVARVVDAAGSGQKAFARRFVEAVGMTPKRYARLGRFQRVLQATARGESVSWSQVAAETGLYDQSHLVNEFRAFAGITPGQYAPRTPDEIRHVPIRD